MMVVSPSPGRKPAQTFTRALGESPRSWCLTWSGAVTTRACSWLMAWVRALIAERRATVSIRIASTGPFPLLGSPVACPFKAARAAAWASVTSVLPKRRRNWRLGRFTSTTSTPAPVR